MDKEILTPLNAIEASLDSLVRSLTTTQTYSAGPKAARDLVKADDDLKTALERLKQHQENLVNLQKLRAEADLLHTKIKDTVLTCVSLRKELDEINSSILDDSDDEDEETTNPVDYETLLAFATRIGKHNAIAAQEAEKLVQQQSIAARKSKEAEREESQAGRNGTSSIDAPQPAASPDRPPNSSAQQTQQVNEQISEFQNRRNWDRAQITAPFPNAEILRIGELGKLQIQREQNGEDYSDAHVEALVKQSELKHQAPAVIPEPPPRRLSEGDKSSTTRRTESMSTGERRPPPERRPEARPKPTLNLDLPDSDSD